MLKIVKCSTIHLFTILKTFHSKGIENGDHWAETKIDEYYPFMRFLASCAKKKSNIIHLSFPITSQRTVQE